MKTITVEDSRGFCEIDPHQVSVSIPPGALPKGSKTNLTVGVVRLANTDHFALPDGLTLVSPIVWICATPEVQLLKPATITLPHCVDLKGVTAAELGMVFGKAHHTSDTIIKGRSIKMYNFQCLDKNDITFEGKHGVLCKQHFCYLCILANKTRPVIERIQYCLVPMLDRSKIIFYIWYLLPTYIDVSYDQGSTTPS